MIQWQYFFGGHSGKSYTRYYKAFINGIRVEKCNTNTKTQYCIGNFDHAEKKYTTEDALLKALN